MVDRAVPELGIYRVAHTIIKDGVRFTAESDLIFLEGEPHIVLEWGGPPDKQFPLVFEKLDPQRLQEPSNPMQPFSYYGDIVDPRKSH
jgi:hypothetical protein